MKACYVQVVTVRSNSEKFFSLSKDFRAYRNAKPTSIFFKKCFTGPTN